MNSLRDAFTYDANRNLVAAWFYEWFNSSWRPLEVSSLLVDGGGNFYEYSGYNFTLAYKLVETEVASDIGNAPATCSLSQNYPNPFNPITTIKYELPASSMVRLSACDMLGREVSVLVNERKDAGVHEVTFDGSNLASGVYFYRLQAGDFVQSKSFVLLK